LTRAVGAEVAVPDPAVFEAMTVTRMVDPTCADAGVKLAPVAPPSAEHEAPEESHCCHW
jgi:hypothetical protein